MRCCRALRTAAIVAIPIVLINVLVSREGLTVFARLGDLGPFGQGDLTVEALVYGAVIALKVTVLILITALCSLAIDPDALLRICRRLSFRSALTASLAVRMIPVLAADAQRIAEAQRTRPDGHTDGRWAGGARARVALIGAMLDRLARPRDGRRRHARAARLRRRPPRTTAVAAVVAPRPCLLRLRRGDPRARAARPIRRHRLVHRLPAGARPVGLGLFALCGALVLAILLPFADRRGIEP